MKRSLRSRYGRASGRGWMSAAVRTPAYDRAANAAFRKAKKEEAALLRDWQWSMTVSTGHGDFRERTGSERKAAAVRAEKLADEATAQRDIILAAQQYARLPKSVRP